MSGTSDATAAIDADEEEAVRIAADRERFRVRNRADLHRVMEKAARAESIVRELEQTRDAEIDRIIEWFRKEAKPSQGDVEFYTGLATQYLKEQIASGAETKRSIGTPWGRVRSRSSPPRPEVVDAKALPMWLVAVERVEKPDTDRIKAETHPADPEADESSALDVEGRVVPGLRYVNKGRQFTVELIP